jgi:hypothetical protein
MPRSLLTCGPQQANTGIAQVGISMFWRLPWEGLHLVCHIRLQSFHHKSALFPTPVPLDILKKGKSRAESLSKNFGSFEHNVGTSKLEQRQMGLQLLLEAHQQLAKAVHP